MVTRCDFLLETVQATAILPQGLEFSTGKAVAIVMRQYGDVFNGNMQAFPIPPGMSLGIPSVTLESSDHLRQLNLAVGRVDCLAKRSLDSPLGDLTSVINNLSSIIGYYIKEMGLTATRLGLVIGRAAPSDAPAETLIKRFCNEASQRQPFNRSTTFEIHNHKEYAPPGLGYRVNSWVRCQCGINPQKQLMIAVAQDLNTSEIEAEARFGFDDMAEFFETMSKEADDILGKYFPD